MQLKFHAYYFMPAPRIVITDFLGKLIILVVFLFRDSCKRRDRGFYASRRLKWTRYNKNREIIFLICGSIVNRATICTSLLVFCAVLWTKKHWWKFRLKFVGIPILIVLSPDVWWWKLQKFLLFLFNIVGFLL